VRRVVIALLYLLAGVGLVFAATFLAPNGCREACPEWFSLSTLAFMLLTPIVWLAVGVWGGRPVITRQALTRVSVALLVGTVLLASAAAYLGDHYQHTSSYGAISG